MPDGPQSAPKPGLFRRRGKPAYETWEQLQQRGRAESMAVLAERRRSERLDRRIKYLYTLWPVGAGLFLALIAPLIEKVALAIGAWAVIIVFPFYVLAQRPEVQAGPITYYLPTVMLFAQFPFEGLLARFLARPHVRPATVVVQLGLFHFLGIVEVFMLGGLGQQIVNR